MEKPDDHCPNCGAKVSDFQREEIGVCYKCNFRFSQENELPALPVPIQPSVKNDSSGAYAMLFCVCFIAPAVVAEIIFKMSDSFPSKYGETIISLLFILGIGCSLYCGFYTTRSIQNPLIQVLVGFLLSAFVLIFNLSIVVYIGCSLHPFHL
jgi:hypothetical protein